MSTLAQDLAYAVRTLRRSPGYFAVALVILALGIGGNTLIFGLVRSVLLRPLPFPDADRLEVIWGSFRRMSDDEVAASIPEYEDYAAGLKSFSGLAAFTPVSANITGIDTPVRLQSMVVSANFFDVLGARAVLGRTFVKEDDAGGIGYVAVVSDRFWRDFLGSDPRVIGRKFRFDQDDFTIIGVLAPDFEQPLDDPNTPTDIWAPTNFRIPQLPYQIRVARFLNVIGRRAPGVTPERAAAELRQAARRLAAQYLDAYPADAGWDLWSRPLMTQVTGTARPALMVLLGAVALVLLAACANLAGLLLARASARQREVAVRLALGATRRRLLRQLLAESVLLALLGAGLGLLLAAWGVSLVPRFAADALPRSFAIGLDGGVLAFTLALGVATGIVFGLVPALQASRPDLRDALREGGRGATGGVRRNRTRAALVVGEVATALVLLVGAGLLLRSFQRLLSIDPGFRADHVLTFGIALPVPNDPTTGRYFPRAARTAFYERVLDEVRRIPGVTSAGATSFLPLAGSNQIRLEVPGRETGRDAAPRVVEWRITTPGFLPTLGIPLLQGRDFLPSDDSTAARVAIVSRSLAKRFFPGRSAIGERVRPGAPDAPELTIVGVAGDVRHEALDADAAPTIYVPHAQVPAGGMSIVARTGMDPMRLANAAAAAVRKVDPEQPVYTVASMEQRVSRVLGHRRFPMILVALFAVEALALAVVGLYGLISYGVAQRRRDLGIRVALGATRRDIVRLVVREGAGLAVAGIAIGLVGALALTRTLTGLLYRTEATDAATFAATAVLLAGVALAASYLPARRAARVDPTEAMRSE